MLSERCLHLKAAFKMRLTIYLATTLRLLKKVAVYLFDIIGRN